MDGGRCRATLHLIRLLAYSFMHNNLFYKALLGMRRMKSQQFPNKEHKINIHLSPFILNFQSGLTTNYAKSVQGVRLNYG